MPTRASQMTAPLTSCNQTSNIPPSSSSPTSSSSSSYSYSYSPTSSVSLSSPAGPAKRVSTCSRMSHSLKQLGEHAESPILASHASTYSTQSPSSAYPPTPRDTTNSTTMPDPNMAFGSWSPFPEMPAANWAWQNGPNPFMNEVNESIDVNRWMLGSGSLAADTNVAVGWKSAEARTPELNGLLNLVENLIPRPPAPVSIKEPHGGNVLVTAPMVRGKRSRPQQGHGDSNENEYQARKRNAPSTVAVMQNEPARPRRIPWEIRDLNDDDFEYSCEWCPFFIHQPLKYDSKPWNSCSKQRAESSHIVTHIVADHGIIRGSNSKRTTQRYLTQCAQNDGESKGKLDCTHCQAVQSWTEEQQQDTSHAGKSVCLRCYEVLPNKTALFNHLQERSICLYREDLPMRRKSRILYSAFCSSSDVPRFRPPPETSAPRDGARKRNMKSNNRPRSVDKTATQSHNQGHTSQPIISPTPPSAAQPAQPHQQQPVQQQPTQQTSRQQSSQHWHSPNPPPRPSPQNVVIKSEYAGDPSGNYFPAPAPTRSQPQPSGRMPFTHPAQPTPTIPLLISRQPQPSVYSEFDIGQPYNNPFSQPLQLAQSDIGSDLGAPRVTVQPQQHSPNMQVGGPFTEKHGMYPANDSGYGSQHGGDPLQPNFDQYLTPQQPFITMDPQCPAAFWHVGGG